MNKNTQEILLILLGFILFITGTLLFVELYFIIGGLLFFFGFAILATSFPDFIEKWILGNNPTEKSSES